MEQAVARQALALEGVLVVDVTRMLPGAILARQLLDLGARLIKVEDPAGGDPFRLAPPQVEGLGAGFATMYRGAESLTLDLRAPGDAAKLARLAGKADVLLESFRPGTLARWGLGPDRLLGENPGLVYCAMSSFGQAGPRQNDVGHDLNFVALAGALPLVGGEVPGLQLADITSGLLACSAVLAALLARGRDGRGRLVDQPLALGPLPFLAWAWADAAAGTGSLLESMLAGWVPCYRCYLCGDGRQIALGALEPKFWLGFVNLLGLSHLASLGLVLGPEGEAVTEEVTVALAARPAAAWAAAAREAGLPVTLVHTPEEGRRDPYYQDSGWTEATPLPSGATLAGVGPFQPSVGRTPARPAPQPGEHNQALAREFGWAD
ncbi:MAG: CoA transferase [Deltaproteobacteria bacterium]|nr:CoA transferase [Deltaproteobacteria bacterium]